MKSKLRCAKIGYIIETRRERSPRELCLKWYYISGFLIGLENRCYYNEYSTFLIGDSQKNH